MADEISYDDFQVDELFLLMKLMTSKNMEKFKRKNVLQTLEKPPYVLLLMEILELQKIAALSQKEKLPACSLVDTRDN